MARSTARNQQRRRLSALPTIQRIRTLPALPPRHRDAHKGDFGKVLVLAGSRGMIGAPALVGNAALRAGAGLVILAVPESIQLTVAALCPCATSVPLPETPDGRIDPKRSRRVLADRGLLSDAGRPDVLITGPGLDRGTAAHAAAFWALINIFRNELHVSTVVDADALNLLRAGARTANGWDTQPHYRTVFTPHPGEMARLHGVSTREVNADREGFAARTAIRATARDDDDHRPVVLLKGAGTIVTDGRRLYVNRTGNPGMATGGSGDVLSGIIGSLLGQRLAPFEAATLGAYLHGLAGDLAAKRIGPVSLIATDIIAELPNALQAFGRTHSRAKNRPTSPRASSRPSSRRP